MTTGIPGSGLHLPVQVDDDVDEDPSFLHQE